MKRLKLNGRTLGILAALWLVCGCVASAQTGSVSGRVIDETGLPLPGVNVFIVGSTLGAATDVEGRYRIQRIPAGSAVLSASAVGFKTERRQVTIGQSALLEDFILMEDVLLSGEVFVTASRRPQAVLDTPASIAVLSASDLEERNIVSIDDALRYLPGVHVQENQVSVRGSSGFAYNTGSRVLLLIDGMPLLTPDTDGMPFDALPVAQIERIEILKGPGSALYGGGALGGVVNVITRDVPDKPRTQISSFVGAHAPVRYQVWKAAYPKAANLRSFAGFTASHARKLSPSLGGWLNLSVRRDEGYLNFSRSAFAQGFGKLNWTPDPSTRGELLVGLLVREEDNFLFWNGARDALNPGSLAIGSQSAGGDPTGTNDVFANQLTVLPSFTKLIGTKLFYSVRGRVFGSVLRPLDDSGKPKSADEGTLGIRYGGEFQLDYSATENRQLTAGVSGDAMVTQSTFFKTADGDSTGGQPETAVFGQWEEQFGATTASAGLRLDRYAIDTGMTISRLSPKFAVAQRIGDGTSVRFAFGHGFRVPSLAERFTDNQDFFPIVRNPGLKPERSSSIEAGIRDERVLPGGWRVQTDVAFFVSDYWDLIEPKLVPELRAFQFINLTRARISGAEVSLEVASKVGELRVAYTLLDAQDRTLGEPLASRSKHQIILGADAKVLKWLSIGADWRGISAPERLDTDFALFVPDADILVPTRVLDVRASAVWGALRASVLLNNALDYYFLERPAFLGPPRHMQLRLQLDF